ncbi:MAG: Uma2 family endonuclease [Silvibacterium sp.]|nr:Uma2 family endonuclease [Silvibacterium sp.]
MTAIATIKEAEHRIDVALAIPALPRTLVLDPPLTDEEFEQLCMRNELARLERTKEGKIIVNALAAAGTGDANSEINEQLRRWWKQHRRGRVFDSSTGFFLPDGSSMSPDAAYITADQAGALRREDLDHFLHCAPAFVIELRSKSDSLVALKQKMVEWIANGAQLGWLIDPNSRSVFVFEPGPLERGQEPHVVKDKNIAGAGPVAGFILDLVEVWNSYQV